MTTNTTNTNAPRANATSTGREPSRPGLSTPHRAPLRGAVARAIIGRAVADLPLRVRFPDGTSIGGRATPPTR